MTTIASVAGQFVRDWRMALAMVATLGLVPVAQAVDRIAISTVGDNELVCDTDGKCGDDLAGFCEDGTTPCTTDDDCKEFYCVGGTMPPFTTCNPNGNLETDCGVGVTGCVSPACLRVHNEDVIVCRPNSTGELNSSCDWSKLFDGVDAGLQSKLGDPDASSERIKAFEFLDDGSLVVQFASTVNGLPGLSTVRDKDLARCAPVREDSPSTPDPYNFPITECAWSLFLNGEGVKSASDARSWDSVAVLEGPENCRDVNGDSKVEAEECDVLLSLPGGDDLGGVPVFDEDILRCIPTAISGAVDAPKTIEACDYAKFLDATEINVPWAGVPAEQGSWSGETFAFDVSNFVPSTFSGDLVARISNQSTNPPHQADKDLMLFTGGFGPTGTCTGSASSCIEDPECGGDGPCGTIDTNPAGTMTMLLDGTGSGSDPQAGLGTVAVDAVAIIVDGDDDEVPDGADNCPADVNPPEICTDGVTVCTPGGGECPPAETCVQKDTDDDGTGDECDICNGRPDTGPNACECGDGVLDVPTADATENGFTNEECDLGVLNGEPDAPCTIACQTSGTCTGSTPPDQPCFSQAECAGNGDCCGDGQTLGAEECDDANGIVDDDCANDCTENDVGAGEGIPIDGICSDVLGPNLIPASVKLAKFNDRSKLGSKTNNGDVDKWKTRGEFILPEGVDIDPDTEDVTITYNNFPVGVILEHTLPDPSFAQKPGKTKWLFKDKEADVAESWRKGKFVERKKKVKFILDGRTDSMPSPDLFEIDDVVPPTQMRQSIRVGDVCATAIVTCAIGGNGKVLKCESTGP